MTDLDIAILGASKLGANGAPLWSPVLAVGNDTDDVEGFGDCQVFQSLGFYSMPWPKDENGYAQTVIARNVGGRDAVCLNATDTRTANIAGALKPGDTVVCSTGPNQAAQLQLKEAKRQAALLTEDEEGYTQLILLDGKAKKLQIMANGAMVEINKDGNISLIDATGGGILVKDGNTTITGELIVGNGQNPMKVMLGPPIGSPGGPAAAPLFAAKGISVSIALVLFVHLAKFLLA